MRSEPLNASLPRIWCDFNACGWSGEPNDNCYYEFDKDALARLSPSGGMRVIAFADEGEGNVLGCEGTLELWRRSWRIRPVPDTWFNGRQ
jgi:hypothetical protein